MTNLIIDEGNIGVAKKKNGHKNDCSCHICENIKNKAMRGGYTEEIEKKNEYINGETNKKNGHRKNCKCPICKNMKNYKISNRHYTSQEKQNKKNIVARGTRKYKKKILKHKKKNNTTHQNITHKRRKNKK